MATPTLIRQIVRAEKLHLARRTAVLRKIPRYAHFTTHEIAGSLTLTTDTRFGRKLNVTIGLGLFGPVSPGDLAAIADTYVPTGLPPELDICVAAAPAAVLDLFLPPSSGYRQTGTIDTFELPLLLPGLDPSAESGSAGADDAIVVTETAEEETFVRASIAGFRSGGRSDELLGLLALGAARRADTTLFLAWRGEELVGSAAMACIEVEGEGGPMKFANLYADSTLPEFRGMGVHAALLSARLGAARGMGCGKAIASARKGSGSARNIVRAGFGKVFESWTFRRVKEGGK